eukprot:11912959-Ditylum_brightwellii.AAC.1
MVSGVSGAGKTETVKIIMKHLATVQTAHSSFSSSRRRRITTGSNKKEIPTQNNEDSARLEIVSKLLQSNPIFEAFGNAKTKRNDNSSRFGRLTKLHFLREQKVNATLGAGE